LVCHIDGGIYPQGLPELDAEENIWTYEDGSNIESGGNCIMGSFMMCPPGQLPGIAVEDIEMGGVDDRLGRGDKS
jgi:hypothetical protein